jgi:zinc/manganese transport system substrate-binding protein
MVAVAALLAGCSTNTPDTHGRIAVVAAENFWGSIATQIGGTRVQVTSIISDPNVDPHLYESDARDAEELATARVVVDNGLGYDDFVDKLLSTTSGHHRTVITAAALAPRAPNDANPHLWYDLPRVRLVACAIERALVAAQPAHAGEFAANEAHFERALRPIDAVLTTIRTGFAHAPVAYTERVPGYLLAAAGLDVVTPSGFARAIEDGDEPSAADTQRMTSLLAHRQVRVLLYNIQATSTVTRRVRADAATAGIPVVGVTETMPRRDTYQAWQLDQATNLLRALQHGGGR